MIPRTALIDAIAHETKVCIHLHGKLTALPPEAFEYRPTEKQRSTLELMRYLGTCVSGPFISMLKEDWSEYGAREEAIAEMTPEEFPEVMERQLAEFREVLEGVDDEILAEQIVKAPGAGEMPLGPAIMRTSYAWLVAYRHELFLRTKGAGNTEINTANNWGGVDWKG